MYNCSPQTFSFICYKIVIPIVKLTLTSINNIIIKFNKLKFTFKDAFIHVILENRKLILIKVLNIFSPVVSSIYFFGTFIPTIKKF